MIRTLTILLGLSAGACAQSLSITSPASGATTLSGTSFTFSSTCSSCPSEYSVEYFIDGNGTAGTGDSIGTAYVQAGFELQWNTFDRGNGPHTVYAIARDAANVTVAASASVSFTIANTTTYVDGSATYDATPTVSASCTSGCSGTLTLTLTLGGSFSTSEGNVCWYAFVDGDPANSGGACEAATSPAATITLDTRSWYDGTHNIKVSAIQGGQFLGEMEQPISFSNGTGSENFVNAQYREIFLTPSGSTNNCAGGSTCSLAPSLHYNNGAAVGSPSFVYYSSNTAVATVNSSGVVSVAGGATTPNIAKINSVENIEGTFYVYVAGTTNEIYWCTSVTCTGNNNWQLYQGYSSPAATPWQIEITGTQTGTCNTGWYSIEGGSGSLAVISGAAGTSNSICTAIMGPSRATWVHVNGQHIFPHFSRTGTVLTSYSPTASFFHTSQFDQGAIELNTVPYASVGSGYYNLYNKIWNTIEIADVDCAPDQGHNSSTVPVTSCASGTESQWQSGLAAFVSYWQTLGQTYSLYMHGIETGQFWGGDTGLWQTTEGINASWAGNTGGTGLQQVQQAWGNINGGCTPTSTNLCFGGMPSITRDDETNNNFGSEPLAGQVTWGTNGLSGTITSTGTTCTVNSWANWNYYPQSGGLFIISGATSSGLNSVSPNIYTPTSTGANNFTFPCTAASGTYTSTTDPGLTIQQYGYAWHTCPSGYSCNSLYNRYNAFIQSMSWIRAASPRPLGVFSTISGSLPFPAINNWQGNSTIADFSEQYCTTSNIVFLYSKSSATTFNSIYDQGDNCVRPALPAYQDGVPFVYGNANEIVTANAWGGRNVSISSIANGLVTFSSAHGVYNIVPGVTRVQISGASNSTYNANFYFASTPTQLTAQIVRYPTVSGSATGAQFTFADGHIYTGISIQNAAPTLTFNWSDSSGDCIIHEVGNTFTISNTGTSWDASGTYYLPYNNPADPGCNLGSDAQATAMLAPSGTSTGGTASIIPDDNPNLGYSIMENVVGPLYAYMQHAFAAIMGAAGIRSYPNGESPQGYSTVTGRYSAPAQSQSAKFNDYSDYAGTPPNQQGAFPLANFGGTGHGSMDNWYAVGTNNQMTQRFPKYLLEPSLPSPDFGPGFESAARSGSYGDMLMVQNFWTTSETITINATPYLVSGQPWLLYNCSYLGCALTVIASGTSSESVTLAAAGTAWAIFPVNEAAELSQAVISTRLADVSGAADVVIQYAYQPYPIQTPQGLGNISQYSVDCGTMSNPCVLPIDLNLGTVNNRYLRIVYRNSSGAVLAQGLQPF